MQGLMVLRKAVVGRMNARLRFEPEAREPVTLDHVGAGFVGRTAEVLAGVRAGFVAPRAGLHPLPQDAPGEAVCGNAGAVIAAVNDFSPTLVEQVALRRFAGRLPPVAVKLAPLHRMGLREFAPYVDFHRRMLRDGEVVVSEWINEAADARDLDRRLRVFVLCFCLGLIAPARRKEAKALAGESAKAGRASVLARIIQRVRGL
ncbi:MAG: hypothetical protein R8K47_03580 [Mariprofundaceae bacterium]